MPYRLRHNTAHLPHHGRHSSQAYSHDSRRIHIYNVALLGTPYELHQVRGTSTSKPMRSQIEQDDKGNQLKQPPHNHHPKCFQNRLVRCRGTPRVERHACNGRACSALIGTAASPTTHVPATASSCANQSAYGRASRTPLLRHPASAYWKSVGSLLSTHSVEATVIHKAV